MLTAADNYYNNGEWFGQLSFRPLYSFGMDGRPLFNPAESLADPPRFSSNGTTVTIHLKPWSWSDGHPLTSRDVEFWINPVRAERGNDAAYAPGGFPDNIVAVHAPDPATIVLTLNRRYNQAWFVYNELSQITPIPQHAWDRTSATGAVGNLDRTLTGAARVYRFLEGQAQTLATYATHPLWQVVDGPWRLRDYVRTTGYAAFVPNPRYSGRPRPHIARFVELPFTSTAAEFDALRAAEVDYGYLPSSDLSLAGQLRKAGFRIAPWSQYAWGGLLANVRSGVGGRIQSQLHIRQALTHAINMGEILHRILHGDGFYVSGSVPPVGGGPFVIPAERWDPYPYDIARAIGLLRQHGWLVQPNGASRCLRPGPGPRQCGAGIPRGASLTFTILISTGSVTTAASAEAITSTAALAGFALRIRTANGNEETALDAACIGTTHCLWNLTFSPSFWPYAPDYFPTGGEFFSSGAAGNYENYSSRIMDRLIGLTHTQPALAAFDRFEAFVVRQQPVIFTPVPDEQISLIKTDLHGAVPQDPFLNITPENWTVTG